MSSSLSLIEELGDDMVKHIKKGKPEKAKELGLRVLGASNCLKPIVGIDFWLPFGLAAWLVNHEDHRFLDVIEKFINSAPDLEVQTYAGWIECRQLFITIENYKLVCQINPNKLVLVQTSQHIVKRGYLFEESPVEMAIRIIENDKWLRKKEPVSKLSHRECGLYLLAHSRAIR